MSTGFGWRLAFYFVIAVGIPACIYHAYSGRFGNAIMAGGAVIAAIGLLATQRSYEATALAGTPKVVESNPATPAERPVVPPDRSPRSARLNGAILGGFVATIVMTLAIFPCYVLAGVFADQSGNRIEHWFWGLTQNSLTSGVFDIPLSALSLNLVAGLVWAFVYVMLAEPRLNGPGWRKGMLFALAPWILSLVVFFPLAGAGFFGSKLDAGPLPVLGNLFLHLIYGATLGAMYALPEVSPTSDLVDDARAARWENDGIAIGLLTGLIAGVAIGGALGIAVNSTTFSDTNLLLASGALGSVVGGMLGAFAGLDIGQRQEAR